MVEPGASALPGRLNKWAYLGGHVELTVGTTLGEIFVVAPDVSRAWAVGQDLGLALAGPGVAVVDTRPTA